MAKGGGGGGQNTKFFHMKAAGRAKKNKKRKLRVDDGHIIIDRKEMGNMARVFFQELYTKDHSVCPTELLHLIEPMITDEMNAGLCKDFSSDEITNALFEIGPLKTPGPDGFPARFFRETGML
jgi:hypothetical protein